MMIAGSADYEQTVSSISGATLTIDSAAHLTALALSEGDAVVIASGEAAEFNVIVDPAASTTTCTVEKTPLASHSTSIKIYKLVQIPVMLE